MKQIQKKTKQLLRVVSLLAVLAITHTGLKAQNYKYVPDDQQLYNTIVEQDSIFFDAYNHCDTKFELYASYYDDSLEFYHDKGGFSNDRQNVLDKTRENICGKVTRELVKGSIEVYPIGTYGAIEMGLHRFHNKAEPNAKLHDSRFIVIWKYKNKQWKISRVISLH